MFVKSNDIFYFTNFGWALQHLKKAINVKLLSALIYDGQTDKSIL